MLYGYLSKDQKKAKLNVYSVGNVSKYISQWGFLTKTSHYACQLYCENLSLNSE